MAEGLRRHSVFLRSGPPFLISEVEVRQPGLINVDDPLARVVQLKHLLSIQHSSDEATLGVTLVGNFFQHPISHVIVIS